MSLAFFKSSIIRLLLLATMSGATLFWLSVAVVITGVLFKTLLTSKVNSLAPPMCPPAKLIVNLLFTSTTTIPGSLSFFTIKGVIALTAIPVELIKITFLQVSNISCVTPFKEKSLHLLL